MIEREKGIDFEVSSVVHDESVIENLDMTEFHDSFSFTLGSLFVDDVFNNPYFSLKLYEVDF